jgi:hypothetical protein
VAVYSIAAGLAAGVCAEQVGARFFVTVQVRVAGVEIPLSKVRVKVFVEGASKKLDEFSARMGLVDTVVPFKVQVGAQAESLGIPLKVLEVLAR